MEARLTSIWTQFTEGVPLQTFSSTAVSGFCRSGDSKVAWELNRQQHPVTLAKAFRLSGDARYADEILRQ
jgi:hypothetical protein